MTADEYLRHWEKNQVWTHLTAPKHRQRLRELAARLEGESFIDVGCAFGHSTAAIQSHRPEMTAAGADFSERTVDRARRTFPRIPFFFSPSFEALQDRTGAFDAVVCSEVMEHVEDERAAAAGLLAITGRILVVSTPAIKVSDPGHLRIYTPESLARLFDSRGAGARDVEVRQSGPFLFLTARPAVALRASRPEIETAAAAQENALNAFQSGDPSDGPGRPE